MVQNVDAAAVGIASLSFAVSIPGFEFGKADMVKSTDGGLTMGSRYSFANISFRSELQRIMQLHSPSQLVL